MKTLLLRAFFISFLAIAASAQSFTFAAPVETVDSRRVSEVSNMLSEKPFAFGPVIADRTAWEKLAAHPAYAKVIPNAEKLLAQPIPEMSDDVYKEYVRTGERTKRYSGIREARYSRIFAYTLAE